MLGSVSAGRNQLSSKHVVQPAERRLQQGISTGQHTFQRHRNNFVQIIAPLRPSNLLTLFDNP